MLLQIRDIHKCYGNKAVLQGVSFNLKEGETLGIVGENGCGKTTLVRIMARLLKADSGKILLQDQNLFGLSNAAMREIRKHMQFVFQNSTASLNPRMKISAILSEPLKNYGITRDINTRTENALHNVGLPGDFLNQYPHQLSVGQRQRVNIARALILQPKVLICDEPTSSLDAPIQLQILNLLLDLQVEMGLSVIFISHDLRVINYVSSRMLVMHNGQIIEELLCSNLQTAARHPYTRQLIASLF